MVTTAKEQRKATAKDTKRMKEFISFLKGGSLPVKIFLNALWGIKTQADLRMLIYNPSNPAQKTCTRADNNEYPESLFFPDIRFIKIFLSTRGDSAETRAN